MSSFKYRMEHRGTEINVTLPICVKDEFLDGLVQTGNASQTAARVGIHLNTAYLWRDDPEFDRSWHTALAINRDGLRERVVETALALGLGEWQPELDPVTEEPVLDDKFEPVMRFETQNVDTRVLLKLMDKTIQDEVQRVDQKNQMIGWDGRPVAPPKITVQYILPDGKTEEDYPEVGPLDTM